MKNLDIKTVLIDSTNISRNIDSDKVLGMMFSVWLMLL